MDKIQEITQKMRNVIKDHPLGFLTTGVDYQDGVDTYNHQNNKAFNGNRGALVVAAGFAFIVLIAIVAAAL